MKRNQYKELDDYTIEKDDYIKSENEDFNLIINNKTNNKLFSLTEQISKKYKLKSKLYKDEMEKTKENQDKVLKRKTKKKSKSKKTKENKIENNNKKGNK